MFGAFDLVFSGFLVAAAGVLAAVMVRRPTPGDNEVLLIRRLGWADWSVARKRAWIVRPFHPIGRIALAPRTLTFDRVGRRAARCRDGESVELRATVNVEVAGDDYALVKLARTFGCDGVNDLATLSAYLAPLVCGAVGGVVGTLTRAELIEHLDEAGEHVRGVLGSELDGLAITSIRLELVEAARIDMASMGPFR